MTLELLDASCASFLKRLQVVVAIVSMLLSTTVARTRCSNNDYLCTPNGLFFRVLLESIQAGKTDTCMLEQRAISLSLRLAFQTILFLRKRELSVGTSPATVEAAGSVVRMKLIHSEKH